MVGDTAPGDVEDLRGLENLSVRRMMRGRTGARMKVPVVTCHETIKNQEELSLFIFLPTVSSSESLLLVESSPPTSLLKSLKQRNLYKMFLENLFFYLRVWLTDCLPMRRERILLKVLSSELTSSRLVPKVSSSLLSVVSFLDSSIASFSLDILSSIHSNIINVKYFVILFYLK